MHTFVRYNASPGTSGYAGHAGIMGTSNQFLQLNMMWDHADSNFNKSIIHRNGSLSYSKAQMNGTLSANTWYGFGGCYDGTNVNSYLNGVLQNSGAASDPVANQNSFVCVLANLTSTFGVDGNMSAGEAAEHAVWDVALTADEFNALAKGLRPTRIRPQNLKFYSPIVRDIYDYKGAALTVTGTGAATDHPRVYG